MAIWVLKSGSKQDANLSSNAYKAANAGFDVPVNPIIRNGNLSPGTANWGLACYEVRINNDLGDSPATNGVSNTSGTYDVLNRYYPDNLHIGFDATQHTNNYGVNLENTPGHRIVCSHLDGEGVVTSLTSTSLATNDYFVVIYSNDYTKHHIAKITESLTYDEPGDAFEFSPAYPSNIDKGTNFSIYKGPLVSNTNVVAVAYGLKGSGLAADDRHVNIYKLHSPNAYFYNDRLEKKNRLNHNTKYKICLSYLTILSDISGTGAGTHAQTICVTEPNYGNRIVDYGPFDTPAKLIDNRRESTTYGDVLSESGGNLQVNNPSKQTKVTISDLSNWDTCFLNIYRSNDNKVLTSSPSGWEGPTRYIHYGTSPDRNNILPTVFNLEVSNSITKAGSYAYVEAVDTSKTLGKKIKRHDRLKFKQVISTGEMTHSKDKTLEGKVWSADDYMTEHNIPNTTFSNNELIVENLPNGYNLKVLLQDKATSVYETIRVGDYHYTISSIGNPLNSAALNANLDSLYQVITVHKERAITANAYGTADTNAKNFIGEPLKRKAWSSITNTLLVDFDIDTNVDYDGDVDGSVYNTLDVACGFTASGNTVDVTAHGLIAGRPVLFNTINTTTGISINTTYYVKTSPNANDFQLVTNSDGSGSAIALTNDGTGIISGDYPATDANVRLDYYGNKSEKDTFTSSRIYNIELELKNAEYYNKSLPIKFGDKLHKYVKLQNPRQLMYQDYTQDNSQWPNYLDYYTGPYIINRLVFKGKVETIEDKIENGLMQYTLSGRDDIATILGPILNKDYKHSEDVVYSTVGPLVIMEDSSGLVNNGGGYSAGTLTITVDSSGSFAAGDLVFLHRTANYVETGHFIGRIASVSGDPITGITFEEGILVNLEDNDKLYTNTSHNLLSFSKSIGSNPFISTTNNLNSASGKGLFFTSGNLITKSSGIPQIESTSLIGTSSNSSSNALGYHLYGAYGAGNDTSFASILSDETDTTSIVKEEKHTPSSITPFDIVSINSGNSNTFIEMAPICPLVLARIDDNPLDIRFSEIRKDVDNIKKDDLIDTGIALNSVSLTNDWVNTLQNIYTVEGDDGQLTNIGDHLYTSDKTYVGKVINKYRKDADEWILVFDHIIPTTSWTGNFYRFEKYDKNDQHDGSNNASVLTNNSAKWFVNELVGMTIKNTTDSSSGTIISNTNTTVTATLTGGTDNDWDTNDNYQIYDTKYRKNTNHIYFLNTQGLNNGGVVQLINSQFSYIGKPIQFAGILQDDASGTDGDFITRYGGFTWKYNDLQIGKPGSISYISKRKYDGKPKMYYAENKGNASGYAIGYKIKPGFSGGETNTEYYKDFYPDSNNTLEKKTIPNRGIYPATGSNFNDSKHHNTATWDLIPKYAGDSRWGWRYEDSAGTVDPWQGDKFNLINEVKDNWELIDPKTIRWFIFGKSDLYPDSKTRQNSLLNQTRKLTDYNLFVRNKPSLESSSISHSNYIGSLSNQKENDGSYETIDITESSITSNEILRFGLMRLIEMTFDWHFNSFDPELPPNKDTLLPEYKRNLNLNYHKYTEISDSGEDVGTINSTTIITTNANTGIVVNDRLYTDLGNYIGKVSGLSTTTNADDTITLASNTKYDPITGNYYTGSIYNVRMDPSSARTLYNENNMATYAIQGKDADHTFSNSSSTKGIHMLQGAIFGNSYGTKDTAVELNFGSGYTAGRSNTGTARANTTTNEVILATGATATNDYYNNMILEVVTGPNAGFRAFIADYVGSTRLATIVPACAAAITTSSTYQIKEYAVIVDGADPRDYYNPGDSFFWYDDTKFGTVKYAGVSLADYTPTPTATWTANQEHTGVAQYSTSGSGTGMQFTITTDASGLPTITDITNWASIANYLLGDTIVIREPSGTKSVTVTLVCLHNLIITSDNGLINNIVNNNNFWSNEGKHSIDIGNHFNGEYGHTDYGGSYSGTLQPDKDNICLPIIGTPLNPGTSTMHTIFDNFYTPSSTTYDELKHPSKVLELVAGGTATASTRSTWRGMRCIFIDRYPIEDKDDYSASKGMSTTTTNYNYRKIDSKVANLAQIDGTTSSPKSYIFIGTDNITFAEKTLKDAPTDNSVSTGSLIGDGAYLGFKPILDTSNATITTIDSINSNLVCKTLKFTVTNTTSNTQWLNFCPDLTGCYLVSVAGDEFGTTTSNTDSVHNSAYNIKPDIIHYIISHEVQYSGATKIHHLVIDNANTVKNIYRVMRPAETCFWPGLLGNDDIKLYTLSPRYTKQSYSENGYDIIPSYGYQNSKAGKTLGKKEEGAASTTGDYNEGVLSMYVALDPDALSYDDTDSTTKRNTSYLVNRQGDYLFNSSGAIGETSSGMLVHLNDGNSKFKTNIHTTDQALTNSYSLTFSGAKNMPKLNGIVSVGKIFSIQTVKPISINNPETAYIGSTVTVGQEAETLINDIFENHDITFTSSAIDYPYIIAPIFKGVDLYTATDYLANIKNRRVISTTDGIKLTKEKDPYDYTNIDITHTNPNINIIDVSRSDNTFDFYNEIIVYGKNVKATKKRSDSIKEIGKKTLEEFDNRITTKEEAIKRARDLLHIHTIQNERYKLKLVANNISLLKPGDVVSVNLPSENIPRRNYIVLENRNSIDGTTELEIGTYDKNMADRLAELFATTKKIDAELRDKQNITTGESVDMNTKVDQKLIKIRIRRVGTTSTLSGSGGIPLLGNLSWQTVYEEVFVR